MNKIRNCNSASLVTGQSKCQMDFGKIKAAIIVAHGQKLAANLTSESFEQAVHADSASRIYPIFGFAEYALNGGEAQVSAVGYGTNQVTDINVRTDAFTLEKYSEHIASAITKAMNSEFDVYFIDEKWNIYGINDGTDVLAGFPMSTIYVSGSPFPTSSQKGQLVINFCHKDARAALEDFDYQELGFNPSRLVCGLVPVKFVQGSADKKWKLVEAQGGYERTEEFGSAIASAGATVLDGVTSLTYASGELTATATGTPTLKAPSVLYTNNIKGIIQA